MSQKPEQENKIADHEPIVGLDIPIDKIITIPNVISLIRLLLIPVFAVMMFLGYDIAGAVIFASAALTDFIDGKIARKTHTVSTVGQYLDPAVDRLAMITGVLVLLFLGRLPIWIFVVVLARDIYLLWGAMRLKKRYNKRVAVIYAGKVATTFLFVGFAGLLLNMPIFEGFGWITEGFLVFWLPGFAIGGYCMFIWFVYIGLIIGAFTTHIY
ncbi:MAG: CDP-alcohol phosphatidyltransferase family protein, partial [Eggerthellaceae bacterium]|nr:CDP-alcohol phosphatidyltransferase family protein [Eggerthellaceae bacterium]